jgi:hypothetical protein
MKLFNFQSEHLVVDYISFNIQGSNNPKLIAFGFNSLLKDDSKRKGELLIFKIENQFQVSCICYFEPKNNSY